MSIMRSWAVRLYVCIMGSDPQRSTEDVDLVIHVDERNITADALTGLLTKSKEFAAVR
jgi:hypothetical protein